MVIGNGLMAKAFSDYEDNLNIVVFASGVSDSVETDDLAFQRESNLLQHTILQYPNAKLLYFSTCSVYDDSVKNRPYVQHKIALEDYIMLHVKDYFIFRISNVVGPHGNSNTIMNYLVNAVKNDLEIPLWKSAERNVIDVHDVKQIVDDVIENMTSNQIVNIATRQSILVKDILVQIEKYFNKKAKVNLIDKGNPLQIDTTAISSSLDKMEALKSSGVQYIFNLLKTYY